MGYAYGTLLKHELSIVYGEFLGWVESLIVNNITQLQKLPKFLRQAIGKGGIKLALHLLDLEYVFTKRYTPSRWVIALQITQG
jgi:hypothetical protein